jgi:hypothetical protein
MVLGGVWIMVVMSLDFGYYEVLPVTHAWSIRRYCDSHRWNDTKHKLMAQQTQQYETNTLQLGNQYLEKGKLTSDFRFMVPCISDDNNE